MAPPKLTTPYLTKFEIARLIGTRMLQVSDQNLQMQENETPQQLAMREILEGKSNAIIRRYLPNGEHEDVRVGDLLIDSRARHFQLNGSV